ncbi:hypothetical protein BH20VER1_BH20VER1_13640 [soil metagenome]
MGIHSGPVSDVTDVSGRTNIAWAGINMAQRVMDCGDAGHILVSQRVADDLMQYRQWAPRLRDLGECEVKHGVRLHLVNLVLGAAGERRSPAKIAAEHAKARRRKVGAAQQCRIEASAITTRDRQPWRSATLLPPEIFALRGAEPHECRPKQLPEALYRKSARRSYCQLQLPRGLLRAAR